MADHRRLARIAVFALAVAAARVLGAAARRLDHGRHVSGVTVLDLGPTGDPLGDAAYARVAEALALIEARSPRTLARLRAAVPRVYLYAHDAESVQLDLANGALILGRGAVSRLCAERVAVLLGAGAVLGRFGWANFRPSPDVRAQMHRRVGRELAALLDELGAAYPTREWYARWRDPLPASEAAIEARIRAQGEADGVPAWVHRVREFLWR